MSADDNDYGREKLLDLSATFNAFIEALDQSESRQDLFDKARTGLKEVLDEGLVEWEDDFSVLNSALEAFNNVSAPVKDVTDSCILDIYSKCLDVTDALDRTAAIGLFRKTMERYR